jgi:membrane associated rhomboid family serine protease
LQVRIGIIYLLSGFGGSVLSALFLRNHNISVGASGALFGLLGSMLSEIFMNWTIYSNKVSRRNALCFFSLLFSCFGASFSSFALAGSSHHNSSVYNCDQFGDRDTAAR